MSYAYSVAIKLSLANLASQGLKAFAAQLLQTHGAVAGLQSKLNALKLTAVGYGLDRVGMGMFGALEKTVDASKEYTRQLSLMNAAGMTQKDIAESVAAAWSTSRSVVTTSAAENLKAIRELRTVFGKDQMGEAYGILPTVQRTKGILEALTGKEQENVAFDMVKAIELRTPGLMSAQAMQRNADLMAKSLMGMGGTLNVSDYHMALKQAKTAAFGLSDQFVFDYFPTLMQEVKGKAGGAQSAGTALMTGYRAIVQGVVKKSSIPTWLEMGLIKPDDIVRNATGQYQIKPGGIKDAQLFQENPYAYANQVLAPAIASYGAKHHLNREQVISTLFGDRNAQWLVNTLIAKAPQFERDRKLIESGGSSLDTYQRLLKTNPQLAEQALHSQYQNILAIIGYQILPVLVPYMVKFANALDGLGQWMQRNPGMLKAVVIGFGALALGLTVLGKVLMTAGIIKFLGLGPAIASAFGVLLGPVGLVIGALVLVGFAAYEVWKHWNYIGPKLQAAWEWIKTTAVAFANWIGARLSGLWEGIKTSASAFVDWMKGKWEWLTHLVHHDEAPAAAPADGTPPAWLPNRRPSSWLHQLSGSTAAGTQTRSFAQPSGTQTINLTSQVNLDGRKVAESVTKHQIKALSAPQTGISGFDGVAALAPAGGVGP